VQGFESLQGHFIIGQPNLINKAATKISKIEREIKIEQSLCMIRRGYG